MRVCVCGIRTEEGQAQTSEYAQNELYASASATVLGEQRERERERERECEEISARTRDVDDGWSLFFPVSPSSSSSMPTCGYFFSVVFFFLQRLTGETRVTGEK